MRQHRLHTVLIAAMAVAVIGAAALPTAQADIFTWVDAAGKVNISNLDPPAGARVTSVTHLNPPKVTPPSDAQREALREQEVQALADRVRQLQDEVEYARHQPPQRVVEYRVAPPPPMMPFGGDWSAPPSYFGTRQPAPEFMSYSQLRTYIDQLKTSGFDVIAQQVALERKASFPFVTLIMTLIAVPFAVTAGRRGAMYGIGVGIVIAITYWVAFSVFAALGTGGVVAPMLAAWAPNLLFGAGAAYLLLTVRT